ncbi:HAD family phosphatase [Telmatospirillum sp.]|uniref:HAD family hydrolase n=1 Tax=Telmatospirillum sp. TaxID=2079197 RepID=UPI0028409B3F|nr:HAD family phosphatase [Telmatospirillum sp.]MDR3440871.1 HAD family phosphatase [Telmatospirillum sp.]
MGVKAVVFDMGGVFLDWNPRYLFQKLFDDPGELDFFLTQVCSPEWNLRQDGGRLFRDGIAEIAENYPRYAAMAALFIERWPEMIGGLIEGTVDAARALKRKGMPLYLLSNCSAETFPLVEERYDFPSLFNGRVVSGEIGLLKPDPAIYHYLLSTFHLREAECLFIDDLEANIDAARDLGFQTHHFRGADGLWKALISLGCLTPQDRTPSA